MGLLVVVLAGVYFLNFRNPEVAVEEVKQEVTQDATQDVNSSKATTTSTTNTISKPGVKTYTMAEIALHNNKADCWMVINGNILDVTSFIGMHPGGDKILKGCGADATQYFNRVPGHMKGMAQSMLNKLKIGELQN